jgi:hypothetical protein
MSAALSELLANLTASARRMGLTDAAWAERAGLRKETLSRLRKRPDCDFSTLHALAGVVGFAMTSRQSGLTTSDDGHFPRALSRDLEDRLLTLCASRRLDAREWASHGPAFFMAGLAVMLASDSRRDRRALLALAERLHPGASDTRVFARWLERTELQPARFLPMLAFRESHAP